jgi:hypothetical protein
MSPSSYIRAMHPKTQVRPDTDSIARMLSLGWIGQLKIHGHRAQLHIPCDPEKDVIAYTRQGKRHSKVLSPKMVKEVRRLFQPTTSWNVIDTEWVKEEEKLYVFDFLKLDGELLRHKTYPERWALLTRNFISPHIIVLPLLKDLASCMKAMESKEDYIEGLVFKSTKSCGFADSSIVRCRKRGSRHDVSRIV